MEIVSEDNQIGKKEVSDDELDKFVYYYDNHEILTVEIGEENQEEDEDDEEDKKVNKLFIHKKSFDKIISLQGRSKRYCINHVIFYNDEIIMTNFMTKLCNQIKKMNIVCFSHTREEEKINEEDYEEDRMRLYENSCDIIYEKNSDEENDENSHSSRKSRQNNSDNLINNNIINKENEENSKDNIICTDNNIQLNISKRIINDYNQKDKIDEIINKDYIDNNNDNIKNIDNNNEENINNNKFESDNRNKYIDNSNETFDKNNKLENANKSIYINENFDNDNKNNKNNDNAIYDNDENIDNIIRDKLREKLNKKDEDSKENVNISNNSVTINIKKVIESCDSLENSINNENSNNSSIKPKNKKNRNNRRIEILRNLYPKRGSSELMDSNIDSSYIDENVAIHIKTDDRVSLDDNLYLNNNTNNNNTSTVNSCDIIIKSDIGDDEFEDSNDNINNDKSQDDGEDDEENFHNNIKELVLKKEICLDYGNNSYITKKKILKMIILKIENKNNNLLVKKYFDKIKLSILLYYDKLVKLNFKMIKIANLIINNNKALVFNLLKLLEKNDSINESNLRLDNNDNSNQKENEFIKIEVNSDNNNNSEVKEDVSSNKEIDLHIKDETQIENKDDLLKDNNINNDVNNNKEIDIHIKNEAQIENKDDLLKDNNINNFQEEKEIDKEKSKINNYSMNEYCEQKDEKSEKKIELTERENKGEEKELEDRNNSNNCNTFINSENEAVKKYLSVDKNEDYNEQTNIKEQEHNSILLNENIDDLNKNTNNDAKTENKIIEAIDDKFEYINNNNDKINEELSKNELNGKLLNKKDEHDDNQENEDSYHDIQKDINKSLSNNNESNQNLINDNKNLLNNKVRDIIEKINKQKIKILMKNKFYLYKNKLLTSSSQNNQNGNQSFNEQTYEEFKCGVSEDSFYSTTIYMDNYNTQTNQINDESIKKSDASSYTNYFSVDNKSTTNNNYNSNFNNSINKNKFNASYIYNKKPLKNKNFIGINNNNNKKPPIYKKKSIPIDEKGSFRLSHNHKNNINNNINNINDKINCDKIIGIKITKVQEQCTFNKYNSEGNINYNDKKNNINDNNNNINIEDNHSNTKSNNNNMNNHNNLSNTSNNNFSFISNNNISIINNNIINNADLDNSDFIKTHNKSNSFGNNQEGLLMSINNNTSEKKGKVYENSGEKVILIKAENLKNLNKKNQIPLINNNYYNENINTNSEVNNKEIIYNEKINQENNKEDNKNNKENNKNKENEITLPLSIEKIKYQNETDIKNKNKEQKVIISKIEEVKPKLFDNSSKNKNTNIKGQNNKKHIILKPCIQKKKKTVVLKSPILKKKKEKTILNSPIYIDDNNRSKITHENKMISKTDSNLIYISPTRTEINLTNVYNNKGSQSNPEEVNSNIKTTKFNLLNIFNSLKENKESKPLEKLLPAVNKNASLNIKCKKFDINLLKFSDKKYMVSSNQTNTNLPTNLKSNTNSKNLDYDKKEDNMKKINDKYKINLDNLDSSGKIELEESRPSAVSSDKSAKKIINILLNSLEKDKLKKLSSNNNTEVNYEYNKSENEQIIQDIKGTKNFMKKGFLDDKKILELSEHNSNKKFNKDFCQANSEKNKLSENNLNSNINDSDNDDDEKNLFYENRKTAPIKNTNNSRYNRNIRNKNSQVNQNNLLIKCNENKDENKAQNVLGDSYQLGKECFACMPNDNQCIIM